MYLFPYEKIPANSSVVIHGYGQVGKDMVRQLTNNRYCHIRRVLDKNAYALFEGSLDLCLPDDFTPQTNDYILLAVAPEQNKIQDEMIYYWLRRGISPDMLITITSPNYVPRHEPLCTSPIHDDILHIGFQCCAGLGDAVMELHLAHKLKDILGTKCRISFITRYAELFVGYPGIDEVCATAEGRRFDVVFVNTYTTVLKYWSPEKIERLSPILFRFCVSLITFLQDTRGEPNPLAIMMYGLLHKKKRAEMVDPLDMLNIDIRQTPPFPYGEQEAAALHKYELYPHKYIALNRDVDCVLTLNHPKLWPIEYYAELVSLIKEVRTDIALVQVGARCATGKKLPVDIDLTGKTNLSELKAILRQAMFMISSEGGLVHLMNLLGGKSVVLYGPTDTKFYGYEENLNCVDRGNECCIPCHYIERNYLKGCVKGHVPPSCMQNLTPAKVYAQILNAAWL